MKLKFTTMNMIIINKQCVRVWHDNKDAGAAGCFQSGVIAKKMHPQIVENYIYK